MDPVLIAALISFAFLVIAWLALPSGTVSVPGQSVEVEQPIELPTSSNASYQFVGEGTEVSGSAR